MQRLYPIIATMLVAFATVAMGQPSANPLPPDVLRQITAERMRTHVEYLASDALMGRSAGQPGLDSAAAYIALEFRRAGLEPMGDNGYYQTITIPNQEATLFMGVSPPDIPLKNVVGLLRGSDPNLRDTYVLMSAHYDHLGYIPGGGGDTIYNGANDNASGVAGMLELARALSSKHYRPRRSILFIGFTGEEIGFVGSRYYANNPVVPIGATIAHLNYEQIGRTDDSEGAKIATANVTGMDYSSIGDVLRQAGALSGVGIERHPVNSDAFFARSDNYPLARKGVPAHTILVAYMFPDYHAVADEAEKLDYNNMVLIVRMTARALAMIADAPSVPTWNRERVGEVEYGD